MARTVPARTAAVAGAVVVLLAGLAACSSPEDDTDPDRRSFPLAGRTLTVDSDDSALEIVAASSHERGRVEVTRWFQGSVAVGEAPKVTWSMRGDRLKLRTHCSGIVANRAAKHRVAVPHGVSVKVVDGDGSVRARGFRDALDIRTGDGSVRVTGTSGPLDIRTGDGSVHVTDTSGPLTLRTNDGSVRAEVSSRRVRARTDDGSVRLDLGAVPDRVDSRSGDGSVTIELPRAAYRVTAETGDGRVNVSVPRDDASSHVVNARTDDGKVTVRAAN
jgi:hypothetical protein